MLSFAYFLNYAVTRCLSLKSSESTFQGLVFFNFYLTQAFILDDGNMESLKQPIIVPQLTEKEKKKRKFYGKKLGVVYGKLTKTI